MKAHAAPDHIPHKTRLLMGLVIHHLLSYFRGNAMNSKNKLWAVLAIKSIDMNTSSVFIFGLKSPQPWEAKLGKKEKKKSSSHRTGSLGSWELWSHPTLEVLWVLAASSLQCAYLKTVPLGISVLTVSFNPSPISFVASPHPIHWSHMGVTPLAPARSRLESPVLGREKEVGLKEVP